MSHDRDFAIEADDLDLEPAPVPVPASAPDVAAAAAPRVVIQYRNRGVPPALVPPALILMAALGFVVSRRGVAVPFLTPAAVPAPERAGPRDHGRIIMVDPSGASATLEPLRVRTEFSAIPPPAPAPALTSAGPPPSASVAPAKPEAVPNSQPKPSQEPTAPVVPIADKDPKRDPEQPSSAPAVLAQAARGPLELVMPVPPDPHSALSAGDLPPPVEAVPPSPEPEVTKEQIWDEIQREADQKRAELQARAEMKPLARRRLDDELRRTAQSERIPFRNALRSVLNSRGKNKGAAIERLCEQFGRQTSSTIHDQVTQVLFRSASRLDRPALVDMMRGHGLPEPIILDYLAREIHYTINSRNGPRDENEVRVRAARVLLSIPVAPRKK
jgi:hypothetical protein